MRWYGLLTAVIFQNESCQIWQVLGGNSCQIWQVSFPKGVKSVGKRAIVDLGSGVIERVLEPGSRVLSAKSVEKLATTEVINKSSGYIKVYDESLQLMLKMLNAPDIRIALALTPYIRYETGLVAYRNGEHIPLVHLPSLLEISERSLHRSVESLVVERVFAKVRVGREIKLYANPYIFMRGVRANKTLVSMFNKSRYAK